MISLFVLKHHPLFRWYFKTPSWLKNILLVLTLIVILFVSYFVYFRSDGGNFLNIMKILKGMNSNTFNYLRSKGQDVLFLNKPIRRYNMTGEENLN